MTLENKKDILIKLGEFLSQFSTDEETPGNGQELTSEFEKLILLSQSYNGWFTPEHVRFALSSWARALTADNLNEWLQPYDFNLVNQKTVALIMAGNVPLVGFHDFISVFLSGHRALIKTSSNDQLLLPFIVKYLISIAPELQGQFSFTEKLQDFDAVIATGSNNTARYFEYYFRDKPSIIRKNRNSVAVLTGNESHAELVALGEDIFRYFGLGCRNVSKLFVPRDYNFDPFFAAMYEYKDVIYYEKYANNYDYNKAVFLMSNFKLLDNEFLTLKEDSSYSSPISSIFYEYYDDLDAINSRLQNDSEQIQCIVSSVANNAIPFGKAQKPELWDYADNVDTLRFLLSL
ncbi:MAG: acyl-CoA reductase [Flavobacterium sp.]|nr:acyl-CoA reductase [Flavobacterium sp.]